MLEIYYFSWICGFKKIFKGYENVFDVFIGISLNWDRERSRNIFSIFNFFMQYLLLL